MAWDSSRTVPWRRLVREWLIYVVIAAAAITIYYRVTDRRIDVGLFSGLLVSGPMYLIVGAILAKFGHRRKTLKELRADRPASATGTAAAGAASSTDPQGAKARPAPTKRTSTGPSQHRPTNKPKRR